MATAPAWATVSFDKQPQMNQPAAYVGGNVVYEILVNSQFESNLVVHDVTPAGHTLLTVSISGFAGTINCTQMAGGMLGTANVTPLTSALVTLAWLLLPG